MGHKDWDGVGEDGLEELAALDRGLQLRRRAGILVVVEVVGVQAAGLPRQHLDAGVEKAAAATGRPQVGVLLCRGDLDAPVGGPGIVEDLVDGIDAAVVRRHAVFVLHGDVLPEQA